MEDNYGNNGARRVKLGPFNDVGVDENNGSGLVHISKIFAMYAVFCHIVIPFNGA